MRSCLLALLALLGASLTARAEYVVLIVDLNSRESEPPPRQAGGQIGAIGGALGVGGGAMGERIGGNIGLQLGGGQIGGLQIGGPPMPGGGRAGGPAMAGGRIGGAIGVPGGGPEGTVVTDADEERRLVVAVIEGTGGGPPGKNYRKWEKEPDKPAAFTHRWGTTHLWPKTNAYQTVLVEDAAGKLLPRVSYTFNQKF